MYQGDSLSQNSSGVSVSRGDFLSHIYERGNYLIDHMMTTCVVCAGEGVHCLVALVAVQCLHLKHLL